MALYKFPAGGAQDFETLRALLKILIQDERPDIKLKDLPEAAVWYERTLKQVMSINRRPITTEHSHIMAEVIIKPRHIHVYTVLQLKKTAAVVAVWHRRRFEKA